MILSDRKIREYVASGAIVIEPFDEKHLGPNSYDVHLSKYLKVYDARKNTEPRLSSCWLDVAREIPTNDIEIPGDGYWLQPGILYLASTAEYTETREHIPYLDGKSSVGRVGLSTHITAGRGDVGFCGVWTMELCVVQPVRVYVGMPIGQITYHETYPVENPYGRKSVYPYGGRDPKPQASRLHKYFKECMGECGGRYLESDMDDHGCCYANCSVLKKPD